MVLADGWPAQSGVADQIEVRKNLAGLIIRDAAGSLRAGVFMRTASALVTARSDMKVDVAAFECAAVRAGGPVFLANDGTVTVSLDPAPVANSRYDVVYARQKEDGYGGLADGSNGPEFGVQKGAASPTPDKAIVLAAIPAGAVPLASILIPSTATATNSSGVVITQEAPFTTARGGLLPFRNSVERGLFSAAPTQIAADLDTGNIFEYLSGWKQIGGPGGWQTATLAANWSAPANYLAPAYRIVSGWCELRGTGRYSATIPTSNTNFLTGLPAPASTDNDSVWLMGPSNASTVIFLNPRTDGIMRARSAATGGAGTDYVHLDGLRYWVG